MVYRGAILYPLRHRADVKPKWDSYPGLADTTESVHATNPNLLKSSVSVEVWDKSLTYTLDPFWVIIAPWQMCHPYTNACSQFVAHCASDFNCRLWRNLRTSEHIGRLEYIICSNISYLFSVLFIRECWYNTVFVYNVPFLPLVIWYNRRLFNQPSISLSAFQILLNRCNKFDHDLHHIFVLVT